MTRKKSRPNPKCERLKGKFDVAECKRGTGVAVALGWWTISDLASTFPSLSSQPSWRIRAMMSRIPAQWNPGHRWHNNLSSGRRGSGTCR